MPIGRKKKSPNLGSQSLTAGSYRPTYCDVTCKCVARGHIGTGEWRLPPRSGQSLDYSSFEYQYVTRKEDTSKCQNPSIHSSEFLLSRYFLCHHGERTSP